MCFSKIYMLGFHPKVGISRGGYDKRQLHPKSSTFMDGSSVLIKGLRRESSSLFCPLTSSGTIPFLQRMQEGDTILETESSPQPDTESAIALILDFPAPRTVGNTCLSLINYPLCHFAMVAGIE